MTDMRRKKVETGFRSIEASLGNFVNTGEATVKNPLNRLLTGKEHGIVEIRRSDDRP